MDYLVVRKKVKSKGRERLPKQRRILLSQVNYYQLLSTWWVIVTRICCTHAEEVYGDDAGETSIDSADDADDDSDASLDEMYIILAFALIFGYLLTLFGSVVAYFSWLEDQLMRRYKQEGEVIQTDVISMELDRRSNNSNDHNNNKSDKNPSYNVIVAYNYELVENYTTRIQMRVKAKQLDFLHYDPRTKTPIDIRSNTTVDRGADFDRLDEYYPITDGVASNASVPVVNHKIGIADGGGAAAAGGGGGTTTTNRPAQTPLLQLPCYILAKQPRSAYPVKEVDRSCRQWLRYRMPTIILVIFNLFLAGLCIAFAASAMYVHLNIGRLILEASAGYLVLVLLQLPILHYTCCRDILEEMLKNDFLERGDFVPYYNPDDESTISSSADDMYLRASPMMRSLNPVMRPLSPTV